NHRMKKILIASLLALTVATASAQNVRIGLKGIFNSTWLFNNNISDRKEDANYAATFGYTSGITSAFYLSQSTGISIDLFYAWHYQTIEGVLSPTDAYSSSTLVNYFDIPILLRFTSEGGPYIEIGPQVSFLAGAKETYDFTSTASPSYSITKKIKGDFNSFNIAGVLGFGYDIEASSDILINVGLRFGYGINDATKKYSEADFIDAQHGTISQLAHRSPTQPTEYLYHKTNRAFGGLSLGVIYKLP